MDPPQVGHHRFDAELCQGCRHNWRRSGTRGLNSSDTIQTYGLNDPLSKVATPPERLFCLHTTQEPGSNTENCWALSPGAIVRSRTAVCGCLSNRAVLWPLHFCAKWKDKEHCIVKSSPEKVVARFAGKINSDERKTIVWQGQCNQSDWKSLPLCLWYSVVLLTTSFLSVFCRY